MFFIRWEISFYSNSFRVVTWHQFDKPLLYQLHFSLFPIGAMDADDSVNTAANKKNKQGLPSHVQIDNRGRETQR